MTSVPRSKVQVPPRPNGLVPRDRLAALLPDAVGEDEVEPPVTLVCAPAGYGKTTLLSWWAARRAEGRDAEPVAWADLDAEDNTPMGLWSAVLTAIMVSGVTTVGPIVRRLDSPRGRSSSDILADLGDAIDQWPSRCWLVLDDVQQLRDPGTLHELDALVRRLPTGLRLVLISRLDPPLSLHRLRLEGRLREIRTPDLAFDQGEVAAVLANHDATLSAPDLDVLLARTEGWPTGVRLAALTLANAEDPAHALAHLIADDHAVVDYLVGEILRDLPPDVLRFVLLTSVCDRFSPELAAALTGRDDAGEIIGSLERGNVLISRCGSSGPWFRYHELLQAYLVSTLNRTRPAEIRRLHGVAARWFERHSDPLTALQHAVRTEDDELISQLVSSQGLALLVSGEVPALRRFAAQLPSRITNQPVVTLTLAQADLAAGDVEAAHARLRVLRPVDPGAEDATMVALRAVVDVQRARWTGGLERAVARLTALRPDDIDQPDLMVLSLANRAAGCYSLGRHDLTEQDLSRVLIIVPAQRCPHLTLHCRGYLAAVSLVRGDYARARERAQDAVRFAAAHGLAHSPAAAHAYGLLAWAAHELVDLGTELPAVSSALDLLPDRAEPSVDLLVRSVVAAAATERGEDSHQALAALHAWWNKLGDGPEMHPVLVSFACAVEVRAALRLGELGWATQAAQRAQVRLGRTGDMLLLRAMLHTHHGRTNAARVALVKVTSGQVSSQRLGSMIEAHLLAAVLAQHGAERDEARTELIAALDLASEIHTLRPFVDGGAPVRRLLATKVGRLGRLDGFAEEVLARIPAAATPIIDALTRREQELLAELPSMRTADEIAEGLFVSVNTVKTHLRSVYRKLGVSSRREAILTARSLGLL